MHFETDFTRIHTQTHLITHFEFRIFIYESKQPSYILSVNLWLSQLPTMFWSTMLEYSAFSYSRLGLSNEQLRLFTMAEVVYYYVFFFTNTIIILIYFDRIGESIC